MKTIRQIIRESVRNMSIPALESGSATLRKPEPPLRSESTKLSSPGSHQPLGSNHQQFSTLAAAIVTQSLIYKIFVCQVTQHTLSSSTERSRRGANKPTTVSSDTPAVAISTTTMLRTVWCRRAVELEQQMEDVAGAEHWEMDWVG